jgi:large subunit ribosomal protein L21
MYAVIQTGGKQYRVAQGDLITIEKLEGAAGDRVEITSVLMIAEGNQVTVGQPQLEQAHVVGTIVRQERGPKVLIYKHKRRKGYQKRQGHRQSQTLLRVSEIVTGAAGDQPNECVEGAPWRIKRQVAARGTDAIVLASG